MVTTAAIYRTDGFVRRASALQSHPLNAAPAVSLHPDDAKAAGLADGQVAKVQASDGTATLPVVINDRVAPGSVWIESGHGATAPIGAGRVKVVAA